MDDDDVNLTQQQRIGTVILGAVFAAFGIFWMIAASAVPVRTAFSSISPGTLPFFAGMLLALMGVLVAITYWRRPVTQAPDAEPLFERKALLRVAGLLAALFVYILMLVKVHAFVAALLLSLVGLVIAGEPLRARLPILAVAIAGSFFIIFVWWLDVPLPGSRYF